MSESNNEAIATFVNAWLPVTTLMLLMSVLPYVFEWIGKKYEGRKTYSDIEESIARRYFLYQVSIACLFLRFDVLLSILCCCFYVACECLYYCFIIFNF